MAKEASRGAEGGSGDEAGGQHRRGVAAFFVAHGLNGLPVEALPISPADAVVEAVALETEFPVDDVLVQLRRGRLFVQAKRTLRFGRPMKEVVGQWLRAVRDPDFRPADDLLAAVGGELSKDVQALALALDRRRANAAIFSVAERRALARVEASLRAEGASELETDLALSRAVLLLMQVETLGQEHSERGRLLLDGHVVGKGEGTKAWRELVAIAGDMARLRLGRSIAAWLEELRKREIPLTIDAAASRAGYLARRREAVARYRQQLRSRGEYVDLTSVGLPIPPIPLSELDADIQVRPPEAPERDGRDLLWSFRRRGRVVLTGLPGGGKSTAMAATAGEWASQEDWALPLVISLRRLAERDYFRQRPLRDQVLDLAVERVGPRDRPLVREALDEALTLGQAALFLDSLDEAANRSLLLASDIALLLHDIHPSTDVLLATRDIAYADTRVLGFEDLRLNSPRNTSKTIAAVLRAIATQRRVAGADAWIATRLEWVKRAMTLDSQLSETPLLPVLLASLAADRDVGELPRSRTLILEQVIENVVRRRAATHDIQVAGLPSGHETDAVLGAFPRIAFALTTNGGSAPRAQLADDIAEYLRLDWGLPSGTARQTATQILVFWDESGIFVASGADKIVTPRLRLFLEIGTALYAASRTEPDAVSWVQLSAVRPDSRETLILAAGRSLVIADALIDCACTREGNNEDALAIAAAEALGQGAPASELRRRQLVERLIPLLRNGDNESWRVFRRLARIDVPSDRQQSILNTIRDTFSPEHYAVARALASVNWNWNLDRQSEYLEHALRIRKLPSLTRRQPRGERLLSARDLFTDPAFMRVKEQAASALLPGRPDLAPVVLQAIESASVGTAEVLLDVLRRNGHGALAATANHRWFNSIGWEQLSRSIKQADDDLHDFLTTLATSTTPAVLTLSQQRRLRELGAFVETLNLNDVSAWIPGDKQRPLRTRFTRLIADLGAFDQTVLAAQALIVLRDMASGGSVAHRAFFSLFDVAESADLTHWEAIPDSNDGRDLLIRVLHTREGSAIVAAAALSSHPDQPTTAASIEAVLDDLPDESVTPAVWAYLRLVGSTAHAEAERFAGSDNHNVREAIAKLVTLAEHGKPSALAARLSRDPCRQVRLAAIERLKKDSEKEASAELLELLRSITVSVDYPFVCAHCGTQNEASRDSCSSCHVVTNRPSIEAAELLKTLQSR
jgi:hypothetical protein